MKIEETPGFEDLYLHSHLARFRLYQIIDCKIWLARNKIWRDVKVIDDLKLQIDHYFYELYRLQALQNKMGFDND